MKSSTSQEVIALANGQEVNFVRRVVAETTETRGAPTNPIRPIVVQPTPQPKPQTANNGR